MKAVYGERGLAGESPRFRGFEPEGDAIRIRFHHVGAGLRTKAGTGPTVGCCAVQAQDGAWHEATGRIDGATLLVSAPGVERPVNVRYAWADYPDESANLENAEGLPCLPFRTNPAK